MLNPSFKSMTILNANSSPPTSNFEMDSSDNEDASPKKSFNVLKPNDTLLRMNDRLNDLRVRSDSRDFLNESVIRASELIRAKDEKMRELEKLVPSDLRMNRISGNTVRHSDTQQTRHSNISFSVASLLADTRPSESPSSSVSC